MLTNSYLMNEELPKTTIGWIAGILDGEGCIYFRPNKSKTSRVRKNISYSLTINIVNTDLRVIEEVGKYFKGSIYIRPAKDKHKEAYSLCLSANESYRLLCMVYDFLICKKERAWLAMELQKIHNDRVKTCAIPLTEKENNHRDNIVNRISTLSSNQGKYHHN